CILKPGPPAHSTLQVNVKADCGSLKFCYQQSTCVYVDSNVLQVKYSGDTGKALDGYDKSGNGVTSWWNEARGQNPDFIESDVNIACASKNGQCPSWADCLKSKTVEDAISGDSD